VVLGGLSGERAARFNYTLDFIAGGIDATYRGADKRELGTVARRVA
jgi:hypothetical protein